MHKHSIILLPTVPFCDPSKLWAKINFKMNWQRMPAYLPAENSCSHWTAFGKWNVNILHLSNVYYISRYHYLQKNSLKFISSTIFQRSATYQSAPPCIHFRTFFNLPVGKLPVFVADVLSEILLTSRCTSWTNFPSVLLKADIKHHR